MDNAANKGTPVSYKAARDVASQWTRWEARAKAMDEESLRWSIQDCTQAAEAGRSIDLVMGGDHEGRYTDERSVYSAELKRRLDKAAKKTK